MNYRIIIPVWANWDIASIALAAHHQFTPADFEIVVVAQGDGVVIPASILRDYTVTTLTDNGANYSRANNKGAALGGLEDGDLLIFLNDDVIVGPKWTGHLMNDYFAIGAAPEPFGLVGMRSDFISGSQGIAHLASLGIPDGAIIKTDRVVTAAAWCEKSVFD